MDEQPHGLDEFSKESDERASSSEPVSIPTVPDALMASASPHDVRGASLRWFHSPALVPVLVVLAVVGYGGFTVFWWERDRPQIGLSISNAPPPTQSFQPTASQVAVPPQPQSEPKTSIVAPPPAIVIADVVPRRVEQPPAPTISRNERLSMPAVRPEFVGDDRTSPPVTVAPAVPVAAFAAAPAAEVAAVAAPPATEPKVVERVVTDRDAIGDVLQSYRAAYNSLDATSASTIWQGVDTRALQRAFATLSRQDVKFDRCEVRVTTAERAVASCRGVLLYVPKVGDGNPQERRLSWNFDFTRAADRWMISSVNAK